MRWSGPIFILLFGAAALSVGFQFLPHHSEKLDSERIRPALTADVEEPLYVDYDYVVYLYQKKRGPKQVAVYSEQEIAELKQAEKLLSQARYDEALSLIRKYHSSIEAQTELGRKWLDLLVVVSTERHDLEQLEILDASFPSLLRKHEEASLALAEHYLQNGSVENYDRLRSNWLGREYAFRQWFFLDADALIAKGEIEAAIDHLNSHLFEGKEDVKRLVRLSLLYYEEDPELAWKHLEFALKKDPYNPDLHLYRANFLEVSGDQEGALAEYLSCERCAPLDPFVKNQIAQFHLRNGNFMEALNAWERGLEPPSIDEIWLQAYFWSMVLRPITFDWSLYTIPAGPYQSVLKELLALRRGKHWDFDQEMSQTKELQQGFWLQLLEALKHFDEQKAAQLLRFNGFYSNSWKPDLEIALLQLLNYRKKGSLDISDLIEGRQIVANPSHPFFQELLTLMEKEKQGNPAAFSMEMHQFLLGREAFAAAFLAAGWNEAALQLHSLYELPEETPEWVAHGLTEALRQNRSNHIALDFAYRQKLSPSLSVLIGEILIEEEKPHQAFQYLKDYVSEDSELGQKAAWLASLIAIEVQEYDEAKRLIITQPLLADSVTGKETLAKIALLEDNLELAEKIYATVVDQSAEAKFYFAKKAFEEQDWRRARALTEDLMNLYPDEPMFKENLQKIIQAEARFHAEQS